MKMRVSIDPAAWARANLRGRRYVTVREVAEMLGIDPRAAGRLLGELERLGIVWRVSRRVYRVLLSDTGQEEV